jgi:uncharacterized protein (TIGR00251 family)
MNVDEVLSKVVNSRLNVVVKPNSSKTEIVKWDEDKKVLRINVNAKPEHGKANVEVIKFFHKLLKKEVTVVSGLTSHNKVLKIN